MRCRSLLFPFFFALLLIPTVPADAEVTLVYLGPLDAVTADDVVPIGDFILGHPGNPAHLLTDLELYQAYTRCLIQSPPACGCTCTAGYLPIRYNLIFAKVGDEEIDAHVRLSLGHAWALDQYPPETVCFEPLGLVCRYWRPFYCEYDAPIAVQQEGYYRLEIAAESGCDCIYVQYTQALHIPSFWSDDWGTSLFLVTDGSPGHCPDFAGSPSMGYIWYQEIDAPGNLLMWIDAVCCDMPVDVEPLSWDRLKALYR